MACPYAAGHEIMMALLVVSSRVGALKENQYETCYFMPHV